MTPSSAGPGRSPRRPCRIRSQQSSLVHQRVRTKRDGHGLRDGHIRDLAGRVRGAVPARRVSSRSKSHCDDKASTSRARVLTCQEIRSSGRRVRQAVALLVWRAARARRTWSWPRSPASSSPARSTSTDTGRSSAIGIGLDYGATLDIPVAKGWRVELLYSRQPTEISSRESAQPSVSRWSGTSPASRRRRRSAIARVSSASSCRGDPLRPGLADYHSDVRFTGGLGFGLKHALSTRFGSARHPRLFRRRGERSWSGLSGRLPLPLQRLGPLAGRLKRRRHDEARIASPAPRAVRIEAGATWPGSSPSARGP